jgi:hypothetical protein
VEVAVEVLLDQRQITRAERPFVRGACLRREPAHQTPDGVVVERLREEQEPTRLEHTPHLAQGDFQLEMVQDGHAEHDIEMLVRKFELMGIHQPEVRPQPCVARCGDAHVELPLRDVGADQGFRLDPARLGEADPGIAADFEHGGMRNAAQQPASKFATLHAVQMVGMAKDPVVGLAAETCLVCRLLWVSACVKTFCHACILLKAVFSRRAPPSRGMASWASAIAPSGAVILPFSPPGSTPNAGPALEPCLRASVRAATSASSPCPRRPCHPGPGPAGRWSPAPRMDRSAAGVNGRGVKADVQHAGGTGRNVTGSC